MGVHIPMALLQLNDSLCRHLESPSRSLILYLALEARRFFQEIKGPAVDTKTPPYL